MVAAAVAKIPTAVTILQLRGKQFAIAIARLLTTSSVIADATLHTHQSAHTPRPIKCAATKEHVWNSVIRSTVIAARVSGVRDVRTMITHV